MDPSDTHSRLLYVERELSDLRADHASHAASQDALAAQIEKLSPAVDNPTEALNKGKGAALAVTGLAGLVGGFAGWWTAHFGSHQ